MLRRAARDKPSRCRAGGTGEFRKADRMTSSTFPAPWSFGGHAVPVIAVLVALTWLFLVADRGQRWRRRAAILVYALALCLAIGECALWLAGRLTGWR
jgi:hypothetical protein